MAGASTCAARAPRGLVYLHGGGGGDWQDQHECQKQDSKHKGACPVDDEGEGHEDQRKEARAEALRARPERNPSMPRVAHRSARGSGMPHLPLRHSLPQGSGQWVAHRSKRGPSLHVDLLPSSVLWRHPSDDSVVLPSHTRLAQHVNIRRVFAPAGGLRLPRPGLRSPREQATVLVQLHRPSSVARCTRRGR